MTYTIKLKLCSQHYNMHIISDDILLEVLTGLKYRYYRPTTIMSYDRFWAFIYFRVFWFKMRQKPSLAD